MESPTFTGAGRGFSALLVGIPVVVMREEQELIAETSIYVLFTHRRSTAKSMLSSMWFMPDRAYYRPPPPIQIQTHASRCFWAFLLHESVHSMLG